MKKKAFITGVAGQDGAYLSKFLLAKDYEVLGLVRDLTTVNFENLDFLNVRESITFVNGDMTDEESLRKIIAEHQPDEVYNLAAQSFVGASWEQAKLTTEVNSLGVLYLLTAIKDFSPKTKFYQASTSEMFGDSHTEGLQTEDTPFHPRSPYAISKLYAYWMTVNFRESYDMFCANGILFNHESPIRGLRFVTRKISDGVARIKLGLADEIRLGNLDSKRDWGFAGDYVKAMWLMLQQEKPDNYILSTGVTHSIRDFLNVAFEHVGITDWERYVKIDPQFNRPVELYALHGKNDKAKMVLGWESEVGFEELVRMMVDADLERLSKNK
ncbi:MAG: GDP-mannose 4,6-dehydratase [Candidatus Moranbacteria bacterium]|nr:GDP-mannose 4,6-dehydratase [Candidatus Moranbacteria bacterium]